MSDKRDSRPPRTGGKPGDRQDRREGGRRDGGKSDRGNRGNQPKYDDTQESRAQKKRMQEIDQDIEKVQREIEKVKGKNKLVVKRARPRLTNKVTIEENINRLKKSVEQREKTIKEEQQVVKRLLDTYNEKKQILNRLKLNVFVPNIGSMGQNEFVQANNKKLIEEIHRQEKKLETESLSINEEKNVVREIKRIKAMKGNFETYFLRAKDARDAERAFNDKDSKLKYALKDLERDQLEIENLKSDLLSIDQREKEAKKIEEEENKKKEQEQKKEQDEVTILQGKLSDLIKLLEEAKEAYRNNRDKWYQSKRDERNKKFEELNQERDEKRREKEKEIQEKIANQRLQRKLEIPYESEITSCQNLINYLSEILSNSKQSSESKPSETKTETKETEKKNEKETGYIKGKEEVEDLLFQGATTTNKKKKATKKKKTNSKITHNWDTFTRFSELGLGEPPIVATEIPASIEKIKTKLSEYQKLSKEKKEQILKEIEEEERKEEEEKKKALEREKEEKEKKSTSTTAPTTAPTTEKKEETPATSTEVKKDN